MPGLFKKENSGVYSLWENQVFTTIGTSLYGLAPSYIKIVLNDNFKDWKLTSYNFYDKIWHQKNGLLSTWKNEADF